MKLPSFVSRCGPIFANRSDISKDNAVWRGRDDRASLTAAVTSNDATRS
jgi:hypothetical protein